MLLGIKTDGPVAEFSLYEANGAFRGELQWEADRQLARRLLAELENFLEAHECTMSQLEGLLAFRGPGSFTGLRIGLTVINTLAYAQSIPVVGETGDDWREKAVKRLRNGENDRIIMPLYGAEARITTPRK